MFFNQQLLTKTGPLGLIWIAGHFKSRKITKKKVLEANLIIVCEELAEHIQKFALPVRASLVLGASIICLRKTSYLLKDADDLKKRVFFRGRFQQGEINMKDVPAEKIARQITLEVPHFYFNQALLDIDFGLLDETLPEIDYEAMRENMAEPGLITLQGETVITRGPPKSDVMVADFIHDDAAAFALVQEQLRESADLLRDATAQGPELGIDTTMPLGFPIQPQRLNFDESPEIPSPQPLPQLPSRASSVMSGRRTELKRKIRHKKVKMDLVNQIPVDTMKANLANLHLATRDPNDNLVNYELLKQRKEEKTAWTTGTYIGGQKMTDFMMENMRDCYVALNRWVDIDEEDPFSWCGTQVAVVPRRDEPRSAGVRSGHEQSLINSTGFATPFEVQHVPEPEISIQQVPSRIEERDTDTFLPPAKRVCKELTKDQELQRYNMCGAFLERRYQKKALNNLVFFDDLMDSNNRKKVSRCFHFILKKAAEGRINVKQEMAYGPIRISKVNPRHSMEG